MTDPLFDDAPADAPYGLTADQSRYRYPDPVTGKPRLWRRVTNHTGAISDQRALQEWLDRKAAEGLRRREDLYDTLCAEPEGDPEQWRRFVRRLMAQARDAAGANEGSCRGAARHRMMQHYAETGELTGHGRMRAQAESYVEALDRAGFDLVPGMTERAVCVPRFGVVGRFDHWVMCRRTGQVAPLDTKTQRRFWSGLEVSAQQAVYYGARLMWQGPDDDTGRWVAKDVGTLRHPVLGCRIALLAHMPQEPGPGQLPVTIKWVDVDIGAAVAKLADEVLRMRLRCKPVGPRTHRVPVMGDWEIDTNTMQRVGS